MGAECLSLPMTRAEPLLLTAHVPSPACAPWECLECSTNKVPGHQPGLGTSVWNGDTSMGLGHQYWTEVFSICSHHPVTPPPHIAAGKWVTVPPHLSGGGLNVWGIHLVAVRAGTAPSVLPQPFVPCAVAKSSSDREGAAGTTLPLPSVSPGYLTSCHWPVLAGLVPKP